MIEYRILVDTKGMHAFVVHLKVVCAIKTAREERRGVDVPPHDV